MWLRAAASPQQSSVERRHRRLHRRSLLSNCSRIYVKGAVAIGGNLARHLRRRGSRDPEIGKIERYPIHHVQLVWCALPSCERHTHG